MDESWTLPELVSEAATRIAALPAPANGQVRAVPDERTIRYYGTLGLLDRPVAMRGRTALYGRRHLAQVIAIKRLQTMGRSLAEIQALWPTLDDAQLSRMAGVAVSAAARPAARPEFWKREPAASAAAVSPSPPPSQSPPSSAAPRTLEVRIELAPHVVLSIAVPDDGITLTAADVRAIRAAAAPVLDELARRPPAKHPGGEP